MPREWVLETEHPPFLVIDEVDGRVYSIPQTSVTHRDGGGATHTIDFQTWVDDFVNGPKDSTCFLNAETIAWFCNKRRPTHGFRANDGRCVYMLSLIHI